MRDLRTVLTRIQMEYIEMPDLKLTQWQARRLWNLDPEACEAALGALVDAKFLWQTREGAYLRRAQPPRVATVAAGTSVDLTRA